MAPNDFSIDSFRPRKREFRADKGKKHSYPGRRKRWNPICLKTKKQLNLSFNESNTITLSMDTLEPPKQFKHSQEVREFMRDAKRKQRSKQGEGQNGKGEKTS
jgi:hypothetical protein